MGSRRLNTQEVAAPGRGGGFSLLELVIVVCIVALLAAFSAERILRYAEHAEKARMEFVISALKSAMGLRYAALYVRGKDADLAAMRDDNPMDWLGDRPSNYLGVLEAPALSTVPAGSWYFEPAKRELVYVPYRTRNLVSPLPGDPRIRFRVRIEFSRDPALGGRTELAQMAIDPVAPYRWLTDLPSTE